MRVIYDNIIQRKHLITTKMVMPLGKHPTDRYHLNMLIIIYIIYYIYIESELYKLVYRKIKVGSIKWNLKTNNG